MFMYASVVQWRIRVQMPRSELHDRICVPQQRSPDRHVAGDNR